MPVIEWDKADERTYETGVDRGVLYTIGNPGVPWNGLISVDASHSGRDKTELYYDGKKYFDLISQSNFSATINAFASPREFDSARGYARVIPGFILTNQPKTAFSLAYRTMINESDYKLHLVYNARVSPNQITHTSLGDTPAPSIFSWRIDATPPFNSGPRSSAHLIIDSRKPDPNALADLEGFLYGKDGNDPSLPSYLDLIGILNNGITEPLAEPI